MLKKRMLKEEKQKEKRRTKQKRSSVIGNCSKETASDFKRECVTYETVVKDAEPEVDMLDWWKQHKDTLPLLAYLARVVFAVPVASSKSERVFSVAGNTV